MWKSCANFICNLTGIFLPSDTLADCDLVTCWREGEICEFFDGRWRSWNSVYITLDWTDYRETQLAVGILYSSVIHAIFINFMVHCCVWFTDKSFMDHQRWARFLREVTESQGNFGKEKNDATIMSNVSIASFLGFEFAAFWKCLGIVFPLDCSTKVHQWSVQIQSRQGRISRKFAIFVQTHLRFRVRCRWWQNSTKEFHECDEH